MRNWDGGFGSIAIFYDACSENCLLLQWSDDARSCVLPMN